MDKTVSIDMSSHIAGWRQGVTDGEAHGNSAQELPAAEEIEELASPTAPALDDPKRNGWMAGYQKGFREGVKKALAS